MPDWTGYFERTQDLPDSTRIKPFLDTLPKQARILDFGCGSGRFSAAFKRDRPDLTIDVLDRHLDKSSHINSAWNGKRYQLGFSDFIPEYSYDGIWAHAVLFLLPPAEMRTCFSMLADALKPNGIFEFSLVSSCKESDTSGFTGLTKDTIMDMLGKNDLETVSFKENPNAVYGLNKTVIPTYHIQARKIKA